MATSIFFGGRRINVPQAVSRVDASALAGVSPSEVGIVALVGTAEGGKPLTVDSEFSDFTNASTALAAYRSGNLKTASQFAFQPSADNAVPGGASRLVNVKVNPATQSTVTLLDDSAGNSLDLTSKDWGLFTTAINIEIAAGTNQGKKITIVFEDDAEVFDDVGGDGAFSLLYTPGTDGYDTALATLAAGSLTVAATKAETGLDAERDADIPATDNVEIVSTDAGDTTQTVTVYGIESGTAVSETISLNGTTVVDGTQQFDKVLGCIMSAAAAGTVTVDRDGAVTTLFTLAPAELTKGVIQTTNTPVDGAVLTVSIDTDTAVDVGVFGTDEAGAAVQETFDMTTGATTPVNGSVAFSNISVIALGDVAAARTVTVACKAAGTANAVEDTVKKAVEKLNTKDGFTAAALVGGTSAILMNTLDAVSTGQSLLTPAYVFLQDLNDIAAKITAESAFIDAARATGATLPPANTASPTFLGSGIEGTVTITQWQTAFTLLKSRRVNIIVPLTEDAAVHSLLLSHLVERSGRLRSEANGYVGIGTAGGAGETKSNIKSAILALNSRHISAISQEIQKFDPITGNATFYPPWMTAVIAAGMQAGSAIGEPLTRKVPIATDIRQDSSWTITDDVEELIDAGLMMLEKVDGVGIRWVRSLTTHLADDNVAFVEMSANESVNTCVFELRTALDSKIGGRALGNAAAIILGQAKDVLTRLVDTEVIVAFQNIQVEQVGDVFPVSVEVAPVLPINFIPITVHLVAVQQAA